MRAGACHQAALPTGRLQKYPASDMIPSLTVDEPMSARIPRDNGISGTFLIVLKTLYAGATSKVF